MREEITRRVPAWAKPQVDERGNVTVTFGSGGKPLLFVAHMDEVGFEIASIADDGTAAVRARGGMYLSVYEAHPVLVATAKGPVRAVLAPRTGYTTAKEAQPAVDALVVYFGTEHRCRNPALGVAAGQSATVRKTFVPLGLRRATGRSMDDRNGSTALLLALQQIDPATVDEPGDVRLDGRGRNRARRRGAPGDNAAARHGVRDRHVRLERHAGGHAASRGRPARSRRRAAGPRQPHDRSAAHRRSDRRRLRGAAKIPLQLGTTSGGTDASAFSAGGADRRRAVVARPLLAFAGRGHGPRDLDALVG